MYIREFINKLEKIEAEYGNIEVIGYDYSVFNKEQLDGKITDVQVFFDDGNTNKDYVEIGFNTMRNALQTNKEPEHDFEEICPLCDHINEYKLSDTKDYKNGKKIVVCQNCGSVMFACNLCDCDGCGKCYIEEGYKF